MPTSTEYVNALSDALVAQAVQIIDQHLSDLDWLRKNRALSLPTPDVASWRVHVPLELTTAEANRVRNLYLKSNWDAVRELPGGRDYRVFQFSCS
jgi:hypothetical protein